MKLKKLLTLSLAATMVFSLAACGNNETKEPEQNTETTVTPGATETPTPEPTPEVTETEIFADENVKVVYDGTTLTMTSLGGELLIDGFDPEVLNAELVDGVVNVKAVKEGVATVIVINTANETNDFYYIDVTVDESLGMNASARKEVIEEGGEMLEVPADMDAIVNTIYSSMPADTLPAVMTMPIDMSDVDIMTYNYGVAELAGLESVVASEPMMTSVAYSLSVLKFDTNENANAAVTTLKDNAQINKWVCVSAEKVSARVVKDNYVIFVMSTNDVVDLVDAVVIE